MGIEEILTAPHFPWQNPYSERLDGSIRRECLDWVIIVSEGHLRRVLTMYFEYYNRYRVHQSLEMDAPEGGKSPATEDGNVVAIPPVGGLHYHYEREAA
jgi:putative transposase